MALVNKNRFGVHQQTHLMSFSVDRTNLFVGKVALHVEEDFDKPSGAFMNLGYGATIAGSSGITNMASGGTTPPRCVGVDRSYDEDSSLAIYTYTFEGIATSHSVKWIEYELEFTMTQEPIEVHQDFESINNVYGPYDFLNRLWPLYITPQNTNAGLGAGGQQQSSVEKNPMTGITSFFAPALVYRISYTNPDADSTLLSDIGTIVKPPEYDSFFTGVKGWIEDPGQKRNWLKMAPKIRQHGSCVSIIEEYMLSGPLGWSPIVYKSGGNSNQKGLSG